jgi:6-pyruvoyl-tetrahydropterin synthase
VLTVSLEGRVNPETGFVRDYAEIKEIVERLVISRVDHQHLGSYNLVGEPGEVYYSAFEENFYPSSENLVLEFVNILQSEFGYLLYEVSLDETCTSRATWRRDG